jgi:hypothetical protein
MKVEGGLLGRGRALQREIRKGNGGMNIFKIHFMHVWKCHNETHYFVHLYMLIKKKNVTQHFI